MRIAKAVDFEDREDEAFLASESNSRTGETIKRSSIRASEKEKLPPNDRNSANSRSVLKSSIPKRESVMVSDLSFLRSSQSSNEDSSKPDAKEKKTKKSKKKNKKEMKRATIASSTPKTQNIELSITAAQSEKRLKRPSTLQNSALFKGPVVPVVEHSLDAIVPDSSIYSIDSSLESVSVQVPETAQEPIIKKPTSSPRFSMFTAKVTQSVAASVASTILSGYGPRQPSTDVLSHQQAPPPPPPPLQQQHHTRMTILSPHTIPVVSSVTMNNVLPATPTATATATASLTNTTTTTTKSPLATRMSLFIPQSMAASLTRNILSSYSPSAPAAASSSSSSPQDTATRSDDGGVLSVHPPSTKRFSIFTTQRHSQSMATSLTHSILSSHGGPASSVASSSSSSPSVGEGIDANAVLVPSSKTPPPPPPPLVVKRFSMFTAQYTQSLAAAVTNSILSGYGSGREGSQQQQQQQQQPLSASKRLSVFSAQYTQSVATSLTKNILSGYLPLGSSGSGSKGEGEGEGNAAALQASSSAASLGSSVWSGSAPSTAASPSSSSSLRRRLNSSIIHSKNMVLTSFSKLMSSRIDEEEEDENDNDDDDGDGESNVGDSSDRDSDDDCSHDPSLLTTAEKEEDASQAAAQHHPQHRTGKRKNILPPPSPSSASSLGQGGGSRAGLLGALGAMFSSTRARRRVDKNQLTPEEVLKNKIKIEQQLNLERAIKAARKRRLVIERKISQYKEFQAQLVNDAPSYETYSRKLHQRVMLIERKDTEFVVDVSSPRPPSSPRSSRPPSRVGRLTTPTYPSLENERPSSLWDIRTRRQLIEEGAVFDSDIGKYS